MEQWSKDRGACQTLQLTLTVATLLLRFKLLFQKLIEKMGLLVLCVFGESPGPCLGGGDPGLGPSWERVPRAVAQTRLGLSCCQLPPVLQRLPCSLKEMNS